MYYLCMNILVGGGGVECPGFVPRRIWFTWKLGSGAVHILCTGGTYYVPDSFLFISNKFCNSGSGSSRVIKFLYAPATPPPIVWALKPLLWALVHETNYAPMIYTSLCITFWVLAYPFTGKWKGVGHWKLRVFWPCHLGPKKLSISRAQPKHPKHYARGCINHRCINS